MQERASSHPNVAEAIEEDYRTSLRRETRQRLVDLVAANVAAYAAGEPANVVSPPLPTPPS